MNTIAETPDTRAALYGMMRGISEALKDPDIRREFEEWYLSVYGKPYTWKYISNQEDYK